MMMRMMFLAVAAAAGLDTAALAQEESALAPAPPQEQCGVFFVQPDRLTFVPIAGYSLLTATPPLTAPPNQPQIDAIICDRPAMFIGPNDHRVLTDLHKPLFIRSGGRVAVMEFTENQVHLRFTEGSPSEAEMQAIRGALDAAQADIDRIAGSAQN